MADANVKTESKGPATNAQAPAAAGTPGAAPNAATAAASGTPGATASPASQAKALLGGAGRQVKSVSAVLQRFAKRRGSIWSDLPQIFPSLFSSDPPTRRMSFLFVLSLIGLSSVSFITVQRYWTARKEVVLKESQRIAKRVSESVKKESDELKRRGSAINMGEFTMELKDALKSKTNDKADMAEVEIVLLCDNKETHDFIEENLPKVRHQMNNVFTAIDREELMSRDGKKKLKRQLIRRLNEWLTHGKVEDVYISKLILN